MARPPKSPKFGQVWHVFDWKEWYPAFVLNVGPERVEIVRLVPANFKSTPTFARLEMFTGGHYKYQRGIGVD